MKPRVSLITLGVRDVSRETAFYRDGLGWRKSSAGDEDVAFFHTGGAIFGLYRRDLLANDAGLSSDGSGFVPVTLSHNVAEKEEVDSVYAAALAAGAAGLAAPREVEWGGYVAHFADPEGFVWEIAWNPFFPLAEDGGVILPD
jgi:uncharacterized glyoxalase superfamily protein PhnB